MATRSQARLFSWGARALFLGPAFGLSPHRNAVGVLALGVDAPFEVALDPERPEQGYRACRTALIPANTLHHFRGGRLMAFLYLDARSPDLAQVRALAQDHTARADFDLLGETELIARLADLATGEASWADLRAHLDGLLRGQRRVADPRVTLALSRLHADPSARPALNDLAAEVGLSPSRFIHLFKAATGVPLRRYKIWLAMGAAMRSIGAGANLTTAAMDAGFASSAHFSTAFREMFGMEPSRLAKGLLAT